MSFLLTRAICARGPLGQKLSKTLLPINKNQTSILEQVTKLSSAATLVPNRKNQNGLSKESLMKIQVRNSSGHDHVALWSAERAVSAVMVPIFPLAFLAPCTTMDYLLAFAITIHSHWGIEAIVVDYVRPSVFGATIPKIALAAVYGLSIATLGGLFYFIYTDVGIVNAIKLLWKL